MSVFGVGNPLLDMMITADEDLYIKYNLKKNDSILAEEKHMSIYKYVTNTPGVQYSAGGSTLNTLRMTQWLLKRKHACTFTGCIAGDKNGERLRNKCEDVQLRALLQETIIETETGKCAVLINGTSRSMVTYLGASKDLSVNFIKKPIVWQCVEDAKIGYISAYVINSCYEGIIEVAKYLAEKPDGLFFFNLSAPFLPTFFSSEVDTILPFVDALFLNEDEALAYADKHELTDRTIPGIAKHLAALPRNDDNIKPRTVIITQGSNPVIVCNSKDNVIKTFDVPPLAPERIVDANGAGDAFTAGFIADYIKQACVESAIASAIKAAAYIIGKSGFSLGDRDQY